MTPVQIQSPEGASSFLRCLYLLNAALCHGKHAQFCKTEHLQYGQNILAKFNTAPDRVWECIPAGLKDINQLQIFATLRLY